MMISDSTTYIVHGSYHVNTQPTPWRFQPGSTSPAKNKVGDNEEVRETPGELADIQANALYILEQAGASRWNLKKIKAKNPVFRFLSMSLIEYLVIMEVHQRRHFWQIEQNLKALEEEK